MIDEWAVSVKPNTDPTVIKKHIEKMVEVSFPVSTHPPLLNGDCVRSIVTAADGLAQIICYPPPLNSLEFFWSCFGKYKYISISGNRQRVHKYVLFTRADRRA